MTLTHIDLFSGVGGFALAAEWAGFETIVFCEKDEYCQKVLKKRWPGVPIIPEIRDFRWPMADAEQSRTGMEEPRTCGQTWECSNASESKILRQENREALTKRIASTDTVTLITGGFPCQPFSVAGKRRGKEDDRFLWPEMFAVISQVRPTWVIAENVTGIVAMELDKCLSDLEGEGYETEPFIISACAVEAKHRRDRVWIVAYDGLRQSMELSGCKQKCGNRINDGSQDVADTAELRQIQCRPRTRQGQIPIKGYGCGRENYDSKGSSAVWPTEPDVGRVAHGIPSRVDRLKCLGNAIVPQVAYEIMRAIREIEQNE